MYDNPKKMIPLNILAILREYTDASHTLSQKDIKDLLERDYNMVVERKTIKRNLMNLIELGFPIEYQEKERYSRNQTTGDYGNNSIMTDFYIEHDFSYSEIRYLMDSIIFSKHIPFHQRKDMIKKLEKMTNKYYKMGCRYLDMFNEITSQNQELFLNLEIIDEAIEKNKALSFMDNEYDMDRRLIPKTQVKAVPYRIITSRDHYYLICYELNLEAVLHYRIDKLTNLKMTEGVGPNSYRDFDLEEYLHTHLYMFPGDPQSVKILLQKSFVGNVVDSFGSNFTVLEDKGDEIIIHIKSNLDDIFFWALKYGEYVTVLEPQELRNKIRETVETMVKSYMINDDDSIDKAISEAEKSKRLRLYRLAIDGEKLKKINFEIEEINLYKTELDDYSVLGRFQDLRTLRINGVQVSNYSFLTEMKQLSSLALCQTHIKDLTVLSVCQNVKRLIIRERDKRVVDQIAGLDILAELPNLQFLDINESMARSIDIRALKKKRPDLKIRVSKVQRLESDWY